MVIYISYSCSSNLIYGVLQKMTYDFLHTIAHGFWKKMPYSVQRRLPMIIIRRRICCHTDVQHIILEQLMLTKVIQHVRQTNQKNCAETLSNLWFLKEDYMIINTFSNQINYDFSNKMIDGFLYQTTYGRLREDDQWLLKEQWPMVP